jgi:hypothetical protein
MDAIEGLRIIGDLKAEIAALNKEGAVMQDMIGGLKALAVSEYGRGYADGLAEGSNA